MSQSLHRSRAFTEIVIAHQQREDILATPVEMIAETHNQRNADHVDRGTADTKRKVPDYVRRIGSSEACLDSELAAVPERPDCPNGEGDLLRITNVNTENGRGTE